MFSFLLQKKKEKERNAHVHWYGGDVYNNMHWWCSRYLYLSSNCSNLIFKTFYFHVCFLNPLNFLLNSKIRATSAVCSSFFTAFHWAVFAPQVDSQLCEVGIVSFASQHPSSAREVPGLWCWKKIVVLWMNLT